MIGSLLPHKVPAAARDVDEGQRGFTLIEMSIVLVIVGLLIGGIIKGQEVVASARLKSQTAQMDAIKGAVFTFQDQFGYLPGDYNAVTMGLAGATGQIGDQNGYVAANAGVSLADTADVSTTESANAWIELGAANLLAGIITNSGSTLASATSATYAGKVGGSFIWTGTISNVYGVTNEMARLQKGVTTPSPVLSEEDASSLDKKFDDGNPGTGDILAAGGTAATGCVTATTGNATYTLGTSSSATIACVMDFILQ